VFLLKKIIDKITDNVHAIGDHFVTHLIVSLLNIFLKNVSPLRTSSFISFHVWSYEINVTTLTNK
jgi:hypothetical protein